MLNKIIIAICSLLSSASLQAQLQVSKLDFPPVLATKNLEISGLEVDSQYFYMPLEKCAKVLKLDIASMSKLDTLPLKGLPSQREIEGAALYADFILLTNEAAPANVFCFNLKKQKLKAVKIDRIDLSKDTLSEGLEGIAVDVTKNVCYLLKERVTGNESAIRQFSIAREGDSLRLTYRSTIKIKHPEKQADIDPWRYTDLYLNGDKLYALKSVFNTADNSKSRYFIDIFDIRDLPLVENSTININDENLLQQSGLEITNLLKPYLTTHSINLEGLAVRGQDIYLISDSEETDGCNSNSDVSHSNHKTLFLKLRFSSKSFF